MENLIFFWLISFLLFLILEMGSPGLFYFLSFFLGSLLAAASTFYFDSFYLQSLIFLIGSIISFTILRYALGKRWLSVKEHPTNVYALHGKTGIVLRKITAKESGQIKVGGEVWSARTTHDITIDVGQKAKVVSVSGSYLIVQKIDNK